MLILFQQTAQYDPGSISKAPSANTSVNARVFHLPDPGREGGNREGERQGGGRRDGGRGTG